MIEYTISYCIYIGADYDSVTLGSCNPMFRILVTCGYPGERGYFVSKKAFLSTIRPKTQFSDGYFMHSPQKQAITQPKIAKKRGISPQISAIFLIFGIAFLR